MGRDEAHFIYKKLQKLPKHSPNQKKKKKVVGANI